MDREGGCLCGAVRYTATLHDHEIGACHCGMCRHWTGGPLMSVRTEALELQQGETLRVYTSSEWAERAFCSTCGSSLYYRLTMPGPSHGTIMLAAGTLDDLRGLKLTHEVYIDHKPEGWTFAGELRGLTEAQLMAMFAPE